MDYLKCVFLLLIKMTFTFAVHDNFDLLTFTLTHREGKSINAILNSGTDPEILYAYINQEVEPGWSLAISKDGYSWEEVAHDLLPEADEGDVISTSWFPGYTHLVVHNGRCRFGHNNVTIGVVQDERLTGFKKLSELEGRYPFLFQLKGAMFLGVVFDGTEMKFFEIVASPNGTLSLLEMKSEGFQERGFLVCPRIFCLESDASKCIFSYDVVTQYAESMITRPVHSQGSIKIVEGVIKFTAYRPKWDYFDQGVSAISFRIFELHEKVLSVGWKNRYDLGADAKKYFNGFTLTRALEYSEYSLLQTPLKLVEFRSIEESFSKLELVLQADTFDGNFKEGEAYLLDLYFDNTPRSKPLKYGFKFSSSDDASYLAIQTYGEGFCSQYFDFMPNLENEELAQTFNVPISKRMHRHRRIKMFIDYATITMFIEDGEFVMTQAFHPIKFGRLQNCEFIFESQNIPLTLLRRSSIITFLNKSVAESVSSE